MKCWWSWSDVVQMSVDTRTKNVPLNPSICFYVQGLIAIQSCGFEHNLCSTFLAVKHLKIFAVESQELLALEMEKFVRSLHINLKLYVPALIPTVLIQTDFTKVTSFLRWFWCHKCFCAPIRYSGCLGVITNHFHAV